MEIKLPLAIDAGPLRQLADRSDSFAGSADQLVEQAADLAKDALAVDDAPESIVLLRRISAQLDALIRLARGPQTHC